jgi:hypothetical protein
LAAVALCAAIGCTSEPVPLSAQAGSTVGLGVTRELVAGVLGIGYGGALLRQNGVFDDQRGELVFLLVDPATQEVVQELVTVLVTRVRADRAANLARQAPPFSSTVQSQVVALVEIPPETTPGTYDVKVSLRRRSAASQTDPSEFPQLGIFFFQQQLTVLPADVDGVVGAPTSPLDAITGIDATGDVPGLYPFPKLLVSLPSGSAAARLVIAYPVAKVEVQDVFADGQAETGLLLSWSNDVVAGQLRIDVVDPTASVRTLAIAFDLTDPFAAGIASPADFSLIASNVYGSNGQPKTSSPTIGGIQ